MDWTPEELQAIVDEHALVLFMKGEPGEPQCGFSNRAAQVLQSMGEPFASMIQPCNSIHRVDCYQTLRKLRLKPLIHGGGGKKGVRIPFSC